MEITPNQNAFLTKLWTVNPNLLPEKESVISTIIMWLHGPVALGSLYWFYYENGPAWLQIAVIYWLWFIVAVGGINIVSMGLKAAAAVYATSLEDRKKYDLEFLSYKSITSLYMNPLQLYNTVLSAALVALLLFTGNYALAISMIVLRCSAEWYRSAIRRYVTMRFNEISGNLYVY